MVPAVLVQVISLSIKINTRYQLAAVRCVHTAGDKSSKRKNRPATVVLLNRLGVEKLDLAIDCGFGVCDYSF
jgi:hypothetical protein